MSEQEENINEEVKKAIEEMSDSVEEKADAAKDAVEETIEKVSDKAEEAKDVVEEKVDKAKDKAEAKIDKAKDKAEEVTETIEEKIQNTNQTGVITWVPHSKRLGAFVIDSVIAFIFFSILGSGFFGALIAAAYMLFKDGLNLDFMDQRSLGKKLLKIRVRTTDGSQIDHMTSIKRNWPFALAYVPVLLGGSGGFLLFAGVVLTLVEGYKVINGNERIGDGMASTYVTESLY